MYELVDFGADGELPVTCIRFVVQGAEASKQYLLIASCTYLITHRDIIRSL